MYTCISNENVEDPKAPGDERRVTILSRTATPPASAAEVVGLGDHVIFGAGSVMIYPDGGIVKFYQDDQQWHNWGG